MKDVLVACGLADEEAAVLIQSDDGGQDQPSGIVRLHHGTAVAIDRDLGVGGPEIDSDNHFAHSASPRSAPSFEPARLATITSAARSSSPSHSKPARDSAITHPSATDGSSRVAGFRKRHDAFAFYLPAARCQRYTFLFS